VFLGNEDIEKGVEEFQPKMMKSKDSAENADLFIDNFQKMKAKHLQKPNTSSVNEKLRTMDLEQITLSSIRTHEDSKGKAISKKNLLSGSGKDFDIFDKINESSE
jgi:hypothetical protein